MLVLVQRYVRVTVTVTVTVANVSMCGCVDLLDGKLVGW